MMTEWNKYFATADNLNVVAHIMDPRFKLRFLADMFKEEGHMIEATFKTMICSMYRLFNEFKYILQLSFCLYHKCS